MPEPVVRRWTRYGHDRLYVELDGGTKVGCWDLATGTARDVVPEHSALFDAAVAQWLAQRQVKAIPAQQPAPEPWHDLASNVPGQGVLAEAQAARQAAPVRTFVARALGVHTQERAWRIGGKGEQAVAARLERLGEGWHALHSIPVGSGSSDIDHVVIGPGGVFTINAKHHPDASVWVGGNTVMVNGQRVPYVRNARHEAQRAGRLLAAVVGRPVPVLGLVAVMGAHRGFTVRAQPDQGVLVVRRKEVRQVLERQPIQLGPSQVEELYAAARRSTTWAAPRD